MTGSRMAWAGSAVAPWGIALGLLVSITAQADQDPGVSGNAFVASAAFEGNDANPALIPAHFTTGAQTDLNAVSDEIEPNNSVKPSRTGFPTINRARKSDPFIGLR